MKTSSFDNILGNSSWVGLGIVGNQAEHLEQAGEAEEFKHIETPENAPKGLFPWFIPGTESVLSCNPISSDHLTLKHGEPLQPEPEIALITKIEWAKRSPFGVHNIQVLGFTIFNDCSRRIKASKISEKKNWGPCSQGMADQIIPIDDFKRPGGVIEKYRLVCYLKRSGKTIAYGKDTAVEDYCYLNDSLIKWILKQIHRQQNQGPLEAVGELIESSQAKFAVIAIGATCYSDFGNSEHRFLREKDEVIVAAYHRDKWTKQQVEKAIIENETSRTNGELLILRQKTT